MHQSKIGVFVMGPWLTRVGHHALSRAKILYLTEISVVQKVWSRYRAGRFETRTGMLADPLIEWRIVWAMVSDIFWRFAPKNMAVPACSEALLVT